VNGADLLAFTILAWPLISGLLLALRALYQAARTHTRSTR
jgi:hypothetical protein